MFDPRGGRKYVSEDERLRYFKGTKADPDVSRRAFCLTLLYTGCRISEALNVTVNRVDVSQQLVIFETLKRRQKGVFRSVPVPESLALLLGRLANGKDTSDRLWQFSRATAYRFVKNLMAEVGITGSMASPKGLRHGFAVACIAKGIPLPTIQKWLGHASLQTTAIYLSVSGEEERDFARRLWFR